MYLPIEPKRTHFLQCSCRIVDRIEHLYKCRAPPPADIMQHGDRRLHLGPVCVDGTSSHEALYVDCTLGGTSSANQLSHLWALGCIEKWGTLYAPSQEIDADDKLHKAAATVTLRPLLLQALTAIKMWGNGGVQNSIYVRCCSTYHLLWSKNSFRYNQLIVSSKTQHTWVVLDSWSVVMWDGPLVALLPCICLCVTNLVLLAAHGVLLKYSLGYGSRGRVGRRRHFRGKSGTWSFRGCPSQCSSPFFPSLRFCKVEPLLGAGATAPRHPSERCAFVRPTSCLVDKWCRISGWCIEGHCASSKRGRWTTNLRCRQLTWEGCWQTRMQ